MGHKPDIIYSDDEASLSTDAMKTYFKDHKISHVITRSHAWFCERFIRTFKDTLYKRVEASKDENIQWTSLIYPILLTYNNKLKHSATGYTTSEAKENTNELTVHLNMVVKKKYTRKYPEILEHDRVKIYRKRKINEKERVSVWSDNSYEVVGIIKSHGQNYYKLNGLDKQYLRHEILKV